MWWQTSAQRERVKRNKSGSEDMSSNGGVVVRSGSLKDWGGGANK